MNGTLHKSLHQAQTSQQSEKRNDVYKSAFLLWVSFLFYIIILEVGTQRLARECVRTDAVGALTRRSLGYHLLHPQILRLLVLKVSKYRKQNTKFSHIPKNQRFFFTFLHSKKWLKLCIVETKNKSTWWFELVIGGYLTQ